MPDESMSALRSNAEPTMVEVGEPRPLRGKAALVTGGNRGLGRAFAVRLARLGANVAICDVDLSNHLEFELDRTQTQSLSAVDELSGLGVQAFSVEQDAADFDAQREIADAMLQRWGRIDVVVCNAGGSVGLPGITMGPAMFASTLDAVELDLILRRNLITTVATCVAVAPAMKSQRSGSIVTIGSVTGIEPLRSGASAHYGVAKAAVVMYTRYLAQELGPFGVRANCLLPGVTGTGRALSVFAASDSELFGKQAVELEERTALRRVMQIDDCTAALEFLATDASRFFTGHVLPVDGGELRGPI
jgi:3-oxoacyl-[acyl-carrier protein] reductase